MFSREESAKIRQEFWTQFGQNYPKKWILYKTKVKNMEFKFHFDTKKAMVLIDISGNEAHREFYFNKWLSLKNLLTAELPDLVFFPEIQLENGKKIARIALEKFGLCIHNRNTWAVACEFLYNNMLIIESFWLEYEDFIKQDSSCISL